MKSSDIYVINGVIFNPIMDIVERARVANKTPLLCICEDIEIFDEAMKTLVNRYPQGTGYVLAPNSGEKMKARYTTSAIYFDAEGMTMTLDVMTRAEYDAHKAAVDAKTYAEKHDIKFTGGER